VIVETAAGFEMTELLLDEVNNSLVSDVAGRGDEEMIRREPFAETILQDFGREFFDGFRRAENRAAKGMLGPEAARKGFVKEIFGVVHVHLDFFEDNLLLVLDVTRIEARVKAEVADDVQSDREMLI